MRLHHLHQLSSATLLEIPNELAKIYGPSLSVDRFTGSEDDWVLVMIWFTALVATVGISEPQYPSWLPSDAVPVRPFPTPMRNPASLFLYLPEEDRPQGVMQPKWIQPIPGS